MFYLRKIFLEKDKQRDLNFVTLSGTALNSDDTSIFDANKKSYEIKLSKEIR